MYVTEYNTCYCGIFEIEEEVCLIISFFTGCLKRISLCCKKSFAVNIMGRVVYPDLVDAVFEG